MNLNRKQKIEALQAITMGKVGIWEILFGNDAFFVKMAGFYIHDGLRFTEKQFEKIKTALANKGVHVEYFICGDSEDMQSFVLNNTKAYE